MAEASQAGYRRLYRSNRDKMLAGVCGGLAEYLNVDPALVRLIAVALFLLAPFAMAVLYLAAALIVPRAPSSQQGQRKPMGAGLGAMLLVGGLLALLLSLAVLGALFGWALAYWTWLCPAWACLPFARPLFISVSGSLLLIALLLLAVALVLAVARART